MSWSTLGPGARNVYKVATCYRSQRAALVRKQTGHEAARWGVGSVGLDAELMRRRYSSIGCGAP